MARYIDADLLLAEVEKQKGDFADGKGNEPLMCWEVADLINDQDTADVVEVKHGEWIEKEEIYGDVYYTCSNCNNDWTTIDGTPQENFMKYCPVCGAKMDGGNRNG